MNLAQMVATGAAAEGVVRALAEAIDTDYQERMDKANNSTDLIESGFHLAAAAALSSYRAILTTAVDVWDADDAKRLGATVVPVRP